ncbi:c-type cytochrome [Thalassotalea aquiviva]|uniref:c-type cytochrome n=1 Tax=Thalassotalea aquiviva TaxID=3242415 RepID=UPI00352AEAFB
MGKILGLLFLSTLPFNFAWGSTNNVDLMTSEKSESGIKAVVVDEAKDANSRHEIGRKLYNYRCYYCHGYSGDAKTLAARNMVPPPRNFAATDLAALSKEQMLEAVINGRENTAMTGFTKFMNAEEIATVVDFIRTEFMEQKQENTRYHTVENGWPEHQKYSAAYPFATGEIALDTEQDSLTEQQRAGLQLYLESCITCHDNSRTKEQGPIWSTQAISYPRNNFSFTEFDGFTGASTYQKHDTFALLENATTQERLGETLYRDNCAFCHAMDGTGLNWIGSFLERKPQNLQDPAFMGNINKAVLKEMIKKGKANTSMPAWESVLTEQQIEAIVVYIDKAFHPLND